MSQDTTRNVTLFKPYKDTNYSVFVSMRSGIAGSWGSTIGGYPIDNTQIKIVYGHYGDTFNIVIHWQTYGY